MVTDDFEAAYEELNADFCERARAAYPRDCPLSLCARGERIPVLVVARAAQDYGRLLEILARPFPACEGFIWFPNNLIPEEYRGPEGCYPMIQCPKADTCSRQGES